MTPGETLSLVVAVGAVLGVILTYVTNRRANRTSEKKLTIEEQQAEDESDDRIAERRLQELERLYARVEKLEAADREKAERIAALERGRNDDKRRMAEMEDHIASLEKLVPDPPGPPPRPWLRAPT